VTRKLLIATALAGLVAAGCAGSATRARGSAEVLRLGIFPNLTHAPGFVALGEGIFEETLGSTRVETTVFNSGTDAGNALLAGSIDATYIGPGPATSLFLESDGGVAVVSGAVSGGASFVVRTGTGINGPQDLPGKKIAVPGIGNTQDIALRTWLEEEGLTTNDEGGEVSVLEVDNPELPQLFQAGELDGAWEPEPYPSLLVEEGLAEVYIDEADLWPGGEFVTTHLLVNTTYMEEHPEVVRRLVDANVQAIQFLNENPDEAKASAQAELIKAGAPSLDQAVVDSAWEKLTFTWDPVASSLEVGAQNAFDLGYLEENPSNIMDLYRIDDLNAILEEQGEQTVEVAA
jgi:NitT/TauT family transport system substrate-binding protein